MSAAPIVEPRPSERTSRLRLIALLLSAWGECPMPGSRIKGESATLDTAPSRRERDQRVDQLLLRLERDAREDEQLEGRADDSNVVAIDRHLQRSRHPAFVALTDAMGVLAVEDPFGCKLVLATYVSASDERFVATAAHGLAYVAGGKPGLPVATPRHALVKAMLRLDELLPAGLVFPRVIHEQVEGWETWMATMRPRRTAQGKTVASGARPEALVQRNRLIGELRAYGFTQAQIGERLGLERSVVAKILQRVDPVEVVAGIRPVC